jgi:transcriptional regulator with GAF, ATPase, and Fis domain
VAFDDTLSAEIEPGGDTPLTPFLFVALESTRPLAGSARYALANIDEVSIGRGDAQAERTVADGRQRLLLRFPDSRLSGEHAVLRRHHERFELTDLGSKNGSFVNGAPQRSVLLSDSDLIQVGSTFLTFRRLQAAPAYVTDLRSDQQTTRPNGLATVMPQLSEHFDRVAQVAAADLPLMIIGETGTGKELMARAAHTLSKRKGPFVPVNCGALASSLLESELFGHKRGAFSGANEDRPGLLRASDGGTLFLDEVAELSLAAQTALLRALQEHEVLPVGAVRAVPVELRVVCATHRDLAEAVESGRFRADLLARLGGFVLRLPPLRERREDLGLIVSTLFQQLAAKRCDQLRFAAGAARQLLTDAWPMNVRALEKCLAAALLVSEGTIETAHLALSSLITDPSERAKHQPDRAVALRTPLSDDDLERRDQLARLLQEHEGNISAIAREMGKERVQVRRWLRRYGLK